MKKKKIFFFFLFGIIEITIIKRVKREKKRDGLFGSYAPGMRNEHEEWWSGSVNKKGVKCSLEKK